MEERKKVKQKRNVLERKRLKGERKRVEEKHEFDKIKLERDIMSEAKALGIAETTAKMIATRSAEKVEKWISGRTMVAQEDLVKKITDELEKYNADLAYVYQNRGRII